jgi:hypothetical protein
MKNLTVTTVFLALLTLPVQAQFENMQIANQLGTILGSSGACNYQVNNEGIERYIEKNVEEEDLNFISTLNMMTESTRFTLNEMPEDQKKAHCYQAQRSARSNGLLSK